MRVTLTRRLGQNGDGSTVDVSTSEGNWLVQRGYAIYDPAQDVPESSEESSEEDSEEDSASSRVGSGPRATPVRRKR